MSVTKIVTYVVALFLIMSFAVDLARSHSWYEPACCDTRDCRQISGVRGGEPWSEIVDHGDAYVWESSETGKTHIIPKSDERIRPSRDGFYHGCEITGEHIEDAYPQCIYVPVLF